MSDPAVEITPPRCLPSARTHGKIYVIDRFGRKLGEARQTAVWRRTLPPPYPTKPGDNAVLLDVMPIMRRLGPQYRGGHEPEFLQLRQRHWRMGGLGLVGLATHFQHRNASKAVTAAVVTHPASARL